MENVFRDGTLYIKRIKIISLFKSVFNFYSLIYLLRKYDPLLIISQLVSIKTTIHQNEFVPESSEKVKWARYIEFLFGLVLSRKFPQKTIKEFDGSEVIKVEEKLETYFMNITRNCFLSTNKNNANEEILNSARMYSLFIRGETYPFLLKQYGLELYSNFDDWFIQKLGFTFNEALIIYKALVNELNKRLNSTKQKSQKMSKEYVNNLINKGLLDSKDQNESEISMAALFYLNESDRIFAFSIEEIIKISGFSEETCVNFLNRLSQEFGYRNPKFKNTFKYPTKSPWDYNTINERPIIKKGREYYVLLPSIINEVLFNTFYYDLISDRDYWESEGEKKYGKWLEDKTAASIRSVFLPENVIIRPRNEKGEELCDVLVLYDRKVIVFQCKTKKMVFESKMGMDFSRLEQDVQKGITAAIKQAISAKNYILSKDEPKIYTEDSILTVDKEQITEIFLICVTLTGYQNLTTRLTNNKNIFDLSLDKDTPWVITLFDLRIICEILESPNIFFHYAKKRIELEKTKFQVMGDEIDMLEVYLDNNLEISTEDFNKYNLVGFSGYSEEIDKYFTQKYEYNLDPIKPTSRINKEKLSLINAIDNLEFPYKTDCILRILDIGVDAFIEFFRKVEILKNGSYNNKKITSVCATLNDGKLGLSFSRIDLEGDNEKLFQQIFSYAKLRKYEFKCNEWIAFGWDINSNHLIDICIYLKGEEETDQIMDTFLREMKIKKI